MAKINPVPAESLKVTMAQSKAWIERTARQAVSSMSAPTAEPQSKKYEEQHLYRAIKKACPPIEGLKKGNVYYANVVYVDNLPYVRVVLMKSEGCSNEWNVSEGNIEIRLKDEWRVYHDNGAVTMEKAGEDSLKYTRKSNTKQSMANGNRISIIVPLRVVKFNRHFKNVFVKLKDGRLFQVSDSLCYLPELPEPSHDNLTVIGDIYSVNGDVYCRAYFVSRYKMQVQFHSRRIKNRREGKDTVKFDFATKRTWTRTPHTSYRDCYDGIDIYKVKLRGGFAGLARVRYISERYKSRWRVASFRISKYSNKDFNNNTLCFIN